MEKLGRARQAADNNIIWPMRFACWMTKATKILRMYNTYSFSASTLITRTRLTVMFIQEW